MWTHLKRTNESIFQFCSSQIDSKQQLVFAISLNVWTITVHRFCTVTFFFFFCFHPSHTQVLSFWQDIIHCHDWSSAPVAWLFKEQYAQNGLSNGRVVFTIHNLEFGAHHIGKAMARCDKATTVSDLAVFCFYYRVSFSNSSRYHFLCERITNVCFSLSVFNCFGHNLQVSYTYSREVSGHGAIAPHFSKFHGIRNGIDPDIWDPYSDNFIPVY